jgi:tRNA(fMet)-specific endonuclease VapC
MRGYGLYREILESYAGAQVLPFDAASFATFASLRAQRLRVGTLDLRIASIALVRNPVVLTRNLRDFQCVPGLTAEDWTL